MFHDQGNAVGLGIQADEPMLGLQLGKKLSLPDACIDEDCAALLRDTVERFGNP